MEGFANVLSPTLAEVYNKIPVDNSILSKGCSTKQKWALDSLGFDYITLKNTTRSQQDHTVTTAKHAVDKIRRRFVAPTTHVCVCGLLPVMPHCVPSILASLLRLVRNQQPPAAFTTKAACMLSTPILMEPPLLLPKLWAFGSTTIREQEGLVGSNDVH